VVAAGAAYLVVALGFCVRPLVAGGRRPAAAQA
jgi:hypothetical protein